MQASSARKSALALQKATSFCLLSLLCYSCQSPLFAQEIAKGSSGNAAVSTGNQSKTNAKNAMPPIHLPENEPLNLPSDVESPELQRLYNTTRSVAPGELAPPAKDPGAVAPGLPTPGTPPGSPPANAPTPGSAGPVGAGPIPSTGPLAPAPVGTRGEGGANTPPGGPTSTTPTEPFILSGYLSVNRTLNEALLRSPRAKAIRDQLKITTTLYSAATVMTDPQLFRDESNDEQVTRIGPQMTWDPPWKLAFRMAAARRQVEEQKLEFLNSLWGFRNQVRGAYLELVMAQESYDTLSALADLSDRLWHISERLYKAGSVAGLDVLKAELAAHQAQTDRTAGEGRIALAKQQLNIIMGRNADMTILVPRLPQIRVKAEKTGLMPNLNKEVPPINEFLEIALSNRWELRILSAQIRVAEAQLRNAIGNIVPDPQIVNGYSSTGNGPTGPKFKGMFWTMNYELPLFTYGQADIPRLKATMRQYQSQILSQRNQIAADVSSAYNHLAIARRRIAVYQDHILAESERVAQLARRSYEVGQSDITSTLAAQQANVQVRQSYLDAVNSYQQAFTELEQAVGVPLI